MLNKTSKTTSSLRERAITAYALCILIDMETGTISSHDCAGLGSPVKSRSLEPSRLSVKTGKLLLLNCSKLVRDMIFIQEIVNIIEKQ